MLAISSIVFSVNIHNIRTGIFGCGFDETEFFMTFFSLQAHCLICQKFREGLGGLVMVSFLNYALVVECILNVSVVNTRVECVIRSWKCDVCFA